MIDYKLLAKSIDYYESFGFKRVESPWTVTEAVVDITKPPGALVSKLVHSDGKCLVASGEQSFLYLFLKGFLPKGAYQTTTPCFRSGDSFDFTHTKYFIKNELIETQNVTRERLCEIVETSYQFFLKIFDPKFTVLRKSESSSGIIDIEIYINGKWYELGSYGIRKCEYLKWIFATGLAEPRASSLIKLQNELP